MPGWRVMHLLYLGGALGGQSFPCIKMVVAMKADNPNWKPGQKFDSTRSGGSKCPYCSGYIFLNPHVHLLVTMRPFNPDHSWGNKEVKDWDFVRDENGNIVEDESHTDWWQDKKNPARHGIRIPVLDENGNQKIGARNRKQWKRKYCWDIISIMMAIMSTAIVIYFGEWIKSVIPINLIVLLLLVHVVYIGIRCYVKDWQEERGYY